MPCMPVSCLVCDVQKCGKLLLPSPCSAPRLAPLRRLQALQGEVEGLVYVGAAAEAVLKELQQARHGPAVDAELELLHLQGQGWC